jgi:signal transduction histidine kinase
MAVRASTRMRRAEETDWDWVSMRERVGLLRGTIDIASKAKAGTEITLRIPLAASEH